MQYEHVDPLFAEKKRWGKKGEKPQTRVGYRMSGPGGPCEPPHCVCRARRRPLLSSLRSTILSVGGYDSICPPSPIISCSIDDAVSSSPVEEGNKVLPSKENPPSTSDGDVVMLDPASIPLSVEGIHHAKLCFSVDRNRSACGQTRFTRIPILPNYTQPTVWIIALDSAASHRSEGPLGGGICIPQKTSKSTPVQQTVGSQYAKLSTT